MKHFFALILLAGSLAACDTQVKDFVDVQPELPVPPVINVAGTNSLKISPGQTASASPSLGITATITPTHQKMSSASLGMSVGISRVTKQ